MTEQDDIKELRTAAKAAADLVGAEVLLKLAELAGHPLPFKISYFGEFRRNERDLSPAGRLALRSFFANTEVGRLITPRKLKARDKGSFIFNIETRPVEWKPEEVPLPGIYLAYHGSHLARGHFVIRVIAIEQLDAATVRIRDCLHNREHTSVRKVLVAPGIFSTFHQWAQILSFHDDNSIGVRLGILNDINPTDGSMVGMLFGMTKNGQHFRRAVAMHRHANLPADPEVAADQINELAILRSGIFSKKELSPEQLSIFRDLSRIASTEVFRDPVIGLALADLPPAAADPNTGKNS